MIGEGLAERFKLPARFQELPYSELVSPRVLGIIAPVVLAALMAAGAIYFVVADGGPGAADPTLALPMPDPGQVIGTGTRVIEPDLSNDAADPPPGTAPAVSQAANQAAAPGTAGDAAAKAQGGGDLALVVPQMPSIPRRRLLRTIDTLPDLNEATALAPAPLPEMTEQTDKGPLPKIGADGTPVWKAYGRPFPQRSEPMLSIIIAGLGLDPKATQAVIDRVPAEVTLSFSPYADKLDEWLVKARQAGHEVMIDLPMASGGFIARDPGPLGLQSSDDAGQALYRLGMIMTATGGYIGLAGDDQAAASVPDPALAAVMAEIATRGLMLIGDGGSSAKAPPSLRPDLRLDAAAYRDALEEKFVWLAETAKTRGYAVAITRPLPVVLHQFLDWMPELQKRSVVLAPASAVLQRSTSGT